MPEVRTPPVIDAPAAARCRWCGAPLDDRSAHLAGRTLCVACGVATTDPFPTSEQLDAAYSIWYRPDGGRFSGPGDRLLRRTRGRLATRVDRLAPPGPVLDVGSGDGTLVAALRATGREAHGLERGDRELAGIDEPQAAIVFWHAL